jgi:RNase P/RNase MRP subunit p30
MALFQVDAGLAKRLGYKKIYSSGIDFGFGFSKMADRKFKSLVVVSKDPGVLMGALRDPEVAGIIFQDNELTKKVLEKAAEMKKTVFVPLSQITSCPVQERSYRIHKMRKIILSSHKQRAKVRIISLAESGLQLLSTAQMIEVGRLLLKGNDNVNLFGGDILC